MERYVYNVNAEDISVDKTELALRLKVPKGFTNETVEKCFNKVKESIKPGCCYVRIPLCVRENTVHFDFASVKSKDLYKNLKDCKEAYLMAITLGIETDRLINRLGLVSKTEGFIADAIASAYAEAILDNMNDYLGNEDRLCPRFSPGYGDLDISFQRDVLYALSADKTIGIKLGENLIMTPRKSITAICGIKKQR